MQIFRFDLKGHGCRSPGRSLFVPNNCHVAGRLEESAAIAHLLRQRMQFKSSLIRIFPSNCETFTDRTYAKLSLWTMLTQSNYSSSQLSSDPPAWGVIPVLFRPTHLKETAHSDVWPVQSRWNPIAIVIIKIYSTFAAKHASASSRIYALAHSSHRGGRGGPITCKQWLFCFCHRLKCQLWRWIWPQSEEQTKYAQVRLCVNRAAESLRSLSALQATWCHVNEQVGRASGGRAFSL